MELFREEFLTIQDDYLRVDPSTEESDDDVDYSNDDLGENTEVTPLGDAVEDDDISNLKVVDPDDEDFDDDDVDVEVEEIEEDDEQILDFSSQIDPDDEDELDDDDDLLADDDLDSTITPDLDDDDFIEEDDDLAIDEDDEDEDITPSSSIDTSADFASRPHGRTTGTMIDHEPGLPG